ncbi:anti-virulence regulator CigR family protein [Pectobacterium sp. CFBP8739]|uniref:anti-virulence regulator CigR family protein n=1 Tax=unclassified Pectobacterium TaxID=2627739 RepID=UPI0015DE38FC|nr:anti-virulence regulator CigR family protein [Pectobacterium sp. CFBP8739]MBA0166551.1 hypothetical protein [Pectobacterium sp. CFBP8739]
MFKRCSLNTALIAAISLSVFSAPIYANPSNGNGGSHGNSGVHGNKSHSSGKGNDDHGKRKNEARLNRVDADISFSQARSLALTYGLVGYQSLPPGIAKNVVRGKPLPPGIAKKTLPASMIRDLPHYVGYEWRAVGKDLVLIALSTSIVTAVINGVFD